MDYQRFIQKKALKIESVGFDVSSSQLIAEMFDHQSAITKWALKKGRAGVFADTGLGKSIMELAWARAIHEHTGNRVLIAAPLCVSGELIKEAEKFGISARYVREHEKDTGIKITNFEMLDNFKEAIADGWYDGLAIDEGSILKHQTSKTRAKITDMAKNIPFRGSFSATPSPNDFMELGSQSEFLGILSAAEMLATFFTHDSGETSKWRLKGHGEIRFWEWLSTWAVCIRRPSDLGFSDEGYDLPPLNMVDHLVMTNKKLSSSLIPKVAETLSERIEARRITIEERVAKCAEIVNASEGPFIVWCHLNDESKRLAALIPGSVEVSGSDKIRTKEDRLRGFSEGRYRILVTKPSIAGFGMNWQHCNQMAFVGLNDSFEELYQAIRRSYRFGQKREVTAHLISADIEGKTLENIKAKEAKHEYMSEMMVKHMREFSRQEITQTTSDKLWYRAENNLILPNWMGRNEMH